MNNENPCSSAAPRRRVCGARTDRKFTVDFTCRRPDTDLFQARFDEALVTHRPLRSDDVWILLRDGKVAHVAPVFIQ